jgi:hypothetical protein
MEEAKRDTHRHACARDCSANKEEDVSKRIWISYSAFSPSQTLYRVHLTACNMPNCELNLHWNRSTGSQEPDSSPVQLTGHTAGGQMEKKKQASQASYQFIMGQAVKLASHQDASAHIWIC